MRVPVSKVYNNMLSGGMHNKILKSSIKKTVQYDNLFYDSDLSV